MWRSAGGTCARPASPGLAETAAAPSGCCGSGITCEGISPSSGATAQAPAPVCNRHSTRVIVMVIGAPTAPCGRIIRRWRIVRRGGRVVAGVAVRVVIRTIVGLREHGAEGECSKPEPNGGTGADPTATPTSTCICGLRHRRQPDSGNDRRGDGQPPTSLSKEPANGHIPSLTRRRLCRLAQKPAMEERANDLPIPYIPPGAQFTMNALDFIRLYSGRSLTLR